MITKDNEPIYRKANGTYVMRHPLTGKCNYWCGFPDDPNGCHAEVESYLAEHPEALVPEPVATPPSPEELLRQEMAQLLAYLASTDWYAIRQSETTEEIPVAVLAERADARRRISEIRGLL